VSSHVFLFDQTRGREAENFYRTIDVQFGCLRRKSAPDADPPQSISLHIPNLCGASAGA
jgi:DNA-binding response OmpR family regulator